MTPHRRPASSPEAPLLSGQAATPIAFVQAIVAAYAARGLNPASVLRQAQIQPSLLANPKARITAFQMEWISGAAMQELDDEALGWFSRRLPWGSYGMLVRASLTAPNLGVALKRWCRHHGLLTDDVGLRVRVSDGRAQLELTERRALPSAQREFAVVSLLRNALAWRAG